MRVGRALAVHVRWAVTLITVTMLCASLPSQGQTTQGPLHLAAQSGEAYDFGVPPTDSLRQGQYHAPTPVSVPGAVTVNTDQLGQMLARHPLVIDVRTDDGPSLRTVAGAVWWPWAGRFGTENDVYFSKMLEQVTGGDKNHEIVFTCLSNQCWLSYNASLRAAHLGYHYVRWYRGGWEAWNAAGGPTSITARVM